ncbi:hypothetical protein BH23ACT9_BH23ACT9_20220 [soil metagenome]
MVTGRSARVVVVATLFVLALVVPLLPASTATADQTSDTGPVTTRLAGSDRVATAVAVAQHVHPSADVAVLARADDFADALAGVPLAAVLDGPLLLTPPDDLPAAVVGELERLGVDEVILLGGPAAIAEEVEEALPDGVDVRRIAGADRTATAAGIADALASALADRGLSAPDGAYLVAAADFPDALTTGVVAAAERRPLLLAGDRLTDATRSALSDMDEVVIVGGTASVPESVEDELHDVGIADVRRIAGADRFATAVELHRWASDAGLVDPSDVWLASGTDFPDALAGGAGAATVGGSLLLVEGRWLEATTEPTLRLRDLVDELEAVTFVGGVAAINADADAQLAALLYGPELPGAGRSLLPDNRIVAFYGSHFSDQLGALGQQPPDQVGPRLEDQATPYRDLSDRPVMLGFNLIATLATAAPGEDGQYRARSTDEEIQQWLDAAREIDAYLILDLQPGRSDFLTEAQVYERFLREPDVGLALDPEWRVGPDEAPGGGRIGSVDAAEVNAVSTWLAELVREEQLPEKLLVLHNFRLDMITNRDQLLAPDGIAINFHMDGEGSPDLKRESYRILRQEPPPFTNGFKVFYERDPAPIMQPGDVMALDPPPVVITYQ